MRAPAVLSPGLAPDMVPALVLGFVAFTLLAIVLYKFGDALADVFAAQGVTYFSTVPTMLSTMTTAPSTITLAPRVGAPVALYLEWGAAMTRQ